MKIVFAGTPAMVVPCLQALHQAEGIDIVGIVSRVDSKAKRGMKMQPSAVKAYALQHGLDVITPTSLKQDDISLTWLKDKKADVLVVAAYGMILPKSWLEAARFGAVNLHASLLPRWRGAAPIERALLSGDSQTGVCIMAMDEGLDTGAVYSRCVVAIDKHTTMQSLREDLITQGSQLLVKSLFQIVDRQLVAIAQTDIGITYAHKIQNHERLIDWTQSAEQVDRQVRTFAPKPGARTKLQAKWLKVLQGDVLTDTNDMACGHVRISKKTLDVGCLNSTYRLLKVQPEGKQAMRAEDFMRGLKQKTDLQMGDV